MNRKRSLVRRSAVVAASGVAALVLAACGGDRNDTGAAATAATRLPTPRPPRPLRRPPRGSTMRPT